MTSCVKQEKNYKKRRAFLSKNNKPVINYILDTNILLHDPRALYHFKNNNIVIPFGVIEEIDRFKKDQSDLGQHAREVCRQLDKLRGRGSLADGIRLDSGGVVRVIMTEHSEISVDKQVIELAAKLQQQDKSIQSVILTKDINLRIRADINGVKAEDYEANKTDLYEICKDYMEIGVSQEDYDNLCAFLPIANREKKAILNQYCFVKNSENEKQTTLGRVGENKKIYPLYKLPKAARNINPLNDEQSFAIDALLNDNIQLVSLIGKAGTGKTLLACILGVYKVFIEKKYSKLVVTKPVMPIGKDIGYLPGDLKEKMNPWVQSIFDALDFINGGKTVDKKVVQDSIVIEPITYMRGRNFHNCYIIVDEAQNLSPMEIKTVITRVGANSKVVLTGDVYQIDNPYVDSSSNGLSIVANKFKNNSLCAHIHFSKGVRSELAELAANTL